MTDKRAAALAAFDRILDGARRAQATCEKALSAFETQEMQVGDTRVVIAGANAVETEYVRKLLGDRDRHRDTVAVLEWEREVLFPPPGDGKHWLPVPDRPEEPQDA